MSHQPAGKFANLRKRAEQILTEQVEALDETPAEELAHVLHELQVHQIELELQNEELRRAQLELEASHRNYLELYDFAPVGYFVLNQAGLLVEANLTCATLLGMERAQLIQQPFWKFVSADDQEVYYFFKKQLFETLSTQLCELKLNIQLDPPVYVKLDGATKLNEEGKIAQAWIAMSDVSAQKEAEKQIFLLAVEKEKIEILRTFLENAAHNLRTPLTTIIASLYLLERQELLDHQKPRVNVIKSQIDRLSNLLENMLTLLQVDEPVDFDFVYLDLNALVRDVVDKCMVLAKQNGLTCTFRPDTTLSQAQADSNYLTSVIANLIINAISYTPAGGEILISTAQKDMNIEISVQDNGIGISDTDLPHIFERFFRSNLAINTDQHGTGLGLSIVEKIVKAHRGQIQVESELGQGSTFRISLPVVSDET